MSTTEDRVQLVRKLLIEGGYMPSLARRFARLDEVPEWLWKSNPDAMKLYSEQVFKEERTNLVHEGATMSWEAFEADVLPTAIALHFIPINRLYDIGCLTTLMDGNAKPITIYDDPAKRNPFTTWIPQQMKHHRGSASWKWKIPINQEAEVAAITYPGYAFGSDERKQDFIRLMFMPHAMVMPGSRGLGLFESELLPELKPVWDEIQRFALNTSLGDTREAFVCIANSMHLEFEYVVTTTEQRTRYFIDRYRENDPSQSALVKTQKQREAREANQEPDGA